MKLIKYIKQVKYVDDSVEKTNSFLENGGIYMKLGCLYNVPRYASYFMVVAFTIFFHQGAYTVYLCAIEDELEMGAEGLHFTICLFWGIAFTLTPQLERKHYNNIYRTLAEGFFNYNDTLDPVTAAKAEEIKKKCFKRKIMWSRRMEVAYNVFGFFCLGVFPIVGGKYSTPEVDDTFLRQAPIQAWFPYETKSLAGYSGALFTEYVFSFLSVCILDGTDIPFLCCSEELLYELEVLNLTLRNTSQRAKYIFKKRFGREPNLLKDNKRFSKCIQECFRDTIRHHYAVNRYFFELNSAYRKILAVVLASGALLLCMAGIIFYSRRFTVGAKLSFLLYMLGELTHIFAFCYYGQQISEQSVKVRDSTYQMDWANFSKSASPYITMLQIFLNQPLKLRSSGGFFIGDYDTFGNVISSSYSYFNLLRAAVDF